MSEIRVRLRSGDNEIEVQGTKSEVDAVLNEWWSRLEDSPRVSGEMRLQSTEASKSRPIPRRQKDATPRISSEDGFDPSTAANNLKENANLEVAP